MPLCRLDFSRKSSCLPKTKDNDNRQESFKGCKIVNVKENFAGIQSRSLLHNQNDPFHFIK